MHPDGWWSEVEKAAMQLQCPAVSQQDFVVPWHALRWYSGDDHDPEGASLTQLCE